MADYVREGQVLNEPTMGVDEPSVIYEGNAQILSGTVYKMWYTDWTGAGAARICYAESSDGLDWTKYASNPLIDGPAQSYMTKDNGTYYLFAALAGVIRRYHSSNGTTFIDDGVVVGKGAGGTWDAVQLSNICVWKEGASWKMIYEAMNAGGVWQLGLATATDAANLTWTKSGSNPVISLGGSDGGPFVHKALDGYYYMWVHESPTGTLPTDIYKYRSTDLVSWSKCGGIISRNAADEGRGGATSQVADPFFVEANGQVYLYYAAAVDQTVTNMNINRMYPYDVTTIEELCGLRDSA